MRAKVISSGSGEGTVTTEDTEIHRERQRRRGIEGKTPFFSSSLL
jgi:hypothetical protein